MTNRSLFFPGLWPVAVLLLLCWMLPAGAAPQTSVTQETLKPLTSFGYQFNRVIPLLDSLEQEVSQPILPLFEAMLGGDLYYQRDTRRVVIKSQDDSGAGVWLDALTQQPVPAPADTSFKRINVNNALRSHLRDAIARLHLASDDASVRRQAATEILGNQNESTLAATRKALEQPQPQAVKRLLKLNLAMAALKGAQTEEAQLQAIHELGHPLEPAVRNLLQETDRGEVTPAVHAAIADSLEQIDAATRFYQELNKIFFGLSLGSVLLLAAIGLAITFGVMGVINMAHGEMMMLGAYTTYVIQQAFPNAINSSLWLAIPAAFIISGLVGIIIERFVIRYLRGRPLESLLATFGISLLLQQFVRTVFSPLNRQVATPDWMSGSWQINPVFALTYNRLYILIFALLVFIGLILLLKKTALGLHVRAVSQNRDMARALGIRSDRVDALTFGLGSGIAGIAGVALSQLTNVGPNLGQAYIIDSFMVVVFGGVGNLTGTLVGAFSLGIANKFLEPVTGAVLAKILILVFIILFIQRRPKGLFPQKGRAAE